MSILNSVMNVFKLTGEDDYDEYDDYDEDFDDDYDDYDDEDYKEYYIFIFNQNIAY